MSPRRIRIFFMLGIIAMTLHFTIMLGIEVVHYLRLESKANALITQWEIINIKNQFGLKAEYKFNAQEKNWQGAFILSPPYFLNEMAALDALKGLAKNDWNVWYELKNPKISALEKNFPTGLLFRTLICYVVLIYFFYLNKRVFLV